MVRILLIIVPILLVLGGLIFWRYNTSQSNLTSPNLAQQASIDTRPIEVPKTLPQATIDERVKALEDLATKLVKEVNSLKTQSLGAKSTSSDSKLSTLEASATELKVRVSALEKATPAPAASTSQSSVYIPLGSGGGPWANADWYSMPEYEISLDPLNYPGYKGMVLEVTYRLIEAAGTASIRLYNTTDSTVTSGELENTSSSYVLKTTSSFTLPKGAKTYRLQVKSTSNKDVYIQSARIKVSF